MSNTHEAILNVLMFLWGRLIITLIYNGVNDESDGSYRTEMALLPLCFIRMNQ